MVVALVAEGNDPPPPPPRENATHSPSGGGDGSGGGGDKRSPLLDVGRGPAPPRRLSLPSLPRCASLGGRGGAAEGRDGDRRWIDDTHAALASENARLREDAERAHRELAQSRRDGERRRRTDKELIEVSLVWPILA